MHLGTEVDRKLHSLTLLARLPCFTKSTKGTEVSCPHLPFRALACPGPWQIKAPVIFWFGP